MIRRIPGPLRRRDSRRAAVAGRQYNRLPRQERRRSIGIDINRSIRGNMSNARKFVPLSSAIAGGTVMRADGGLVWTGRSDTTHPTVSIPICRGLMR